MRWAGLPKVETCLAMARVALQRQTPAFCALHPDFFYANLYASLYSAISLHQPLKIFTDMILWMILALPRLSAALSRPATSHGEKCAMRNGSTGTLDDGVIDPNRSVGPKTSGLSRTSLYGHWTAQIFSDMTVTTGAFQADRPAHAPLPSLPSS